MNLQFTLQLNTATLICISAVAALIVGLLLDKSGALTQSGGALRLPSTFGIGLLLASVILTVVLGINAYFAAATISGLLAEFFGILSVLLVLAVR